MLTLDSSLQIPGYVLFVNLDQDAVLLNTQNNQYYALDEVGARLWALLNQKKQLREAHQALLDEYEVDPAQLEQDILELLNHLMEKDLVEIAQT